MIRGNLWDWISSCLDWLVLWKVHYIVGGAGSGPIVGGAGSSPGKELDKKLDLPLVGGTHPDQI